jgi:hypothetical protein
VLDVGWPGGAAGCDGPSCSPDLVSTRWFFRASRYGWDTITSARTAGCTQVHKVDPQFPARLCAASPHWDEQSGAVIRERLARPDATPVHLRNVGCGCDRPLPVW